MINNNEHYPDIGNITILDILDEYESMPVVYIGNNDKDKTYLFQTISDKNNSIEIIATEINNDNYNDIKSNKIPIQYIYNNNDIFYIYEKNILDSSHMDLKKTLKQDQIDRYGVKHGETYLGE